MREYGGGGVVAQCLHRKITCNFTQICTGNPQNDDDQFFNFVDIIEANHSRKNVLINIIVKTSHPLVEMDHMESSTK